MAEMITTQMLKEFARILADEFARKGVSSFAEESVKKTRTTATVRGGEDPKARLMRESREKAQEIRQQRGMIDSLSLGTSAMGKLITSVEDLTTIEKTFPAMLRNTLEKTGSHFAKSVTDLESALQLPQLTAGVQNLQAAFEAYGRKELSAEELQSAFDDVEESGVDLADVFSKIAGISKEQFHELRNNLTKGGEEQFAAAHKLSTSFDKVRKETEKVSMAMHESATQARIFGTLKDTVSGAIKQFGHWTTVVAIATKTITQFRTDMRAAARVGTPQSILSNWTDALRMGLDPEVIAEIGATSRQALLSVGGMDKFMGRLSANVDAFATLTGSQADGAKAAAAALTTLRRVGLQGTNEEMTMMVKEFDKLQTMTGMTADEFKEYTNRMTQDSEMRAVLARMDEKQRALMVKGIFARNRELIAIGMIPEQAEAAAKALSGFAKKSPIEQMKAAAKMQAVMGAVGMGSQGARAAELMRNIPGLQGEERARAESELAKLATQTNNTLQKMKGSADMSTRMLASTLEMRSPELAEFLDETGPFNTNLSKGMEIQQSTLDGITKVNDSIANKANIWLEKIYTTLQNPILNSLLTAGSLLTSILTNVGLIAIAAKGLPGLAASTTAAGGLKGAATGMANAATKLAGAAVAWEAGQQLGTAMYEGMNQDMQDWIGRLGATVMGVFDEDARSIGFFGESLEDKQAKISQQEMKLREQQTKAQIENQEKLAKERSQTDQKLLASVQALVNVMVENGSMTQKQGEQQVRAILGTTDKNAEHFDKLAKELKRTGATSRNTVTTGR